MSARLQIRLFLTWLLSVYGLSAGVNTQAQELALSSSPLYLGTQIDPNIFFMLDDSGSMDWEILTVDYQYHTNYWADNNEAKIRDGYFYANSGSGTACTGERDNAYIYKTTDNVYNSCTYAVLADHEDAYLRDWRVRSSDLNIMYYNPAATYSPWWDFPDASFTAARSNPQPDSTGYTLTRNLTGFIYEVAIDDHGYNASNDLVDGPDDVNDTPNDEVDLYDSHTRYTVNTSDITVNAFTTLNAAGIIAKPNCGLTDYLDSPMYFDCYGTTLITTTMSGSDEDEWGRNITEIKQNIANWYQYHRKRSFVAKAAIARVANSYPGFRYGMSLINNNATVFAEVPGEDDEDYTDNIDAMLNELYDYPWSAAGTPLRRGLEVVGRYYSDYYSSTKADPIISACQQNYAVLFSDGYWNGSSPFTSAISDEDGDSYSDTLADVAHYFYTEDLSSLPNDVPTTALDPNDKQHMVTFTVAFGLSGNLVDTNDDRYPDPELVSSDVWGGNPGSSDLAKIDDMWHAAFNSKGYYVQAETTEGVANAISEALLEIADRVGSSASVATNTGSLNAGSHLFQARFDSSDWRGQLLAFQINLDGTIDEEAAWEAGNVLNTQNYNTGREIITWNPEADVVPGGDPEGQGIPFRFPSDYQSPNALTDMTEEQIAFLLTNADFAIDSMDVGEIADNQDFGSDMVNYLRGDTTNEGVGREFRNRNSVLGDIVNSDPRFVGEPNFDYPAALQVKSYADFVTDNEERAGVVYAGANDGLLHGFDEDTGAELIAFMPNAVYDNIWELATLDYIHRYYVDGGPNIVDAFLADMDDPDSVTNGLWRTVLASGLNTGGQAIYALDVTDPSIFDESNADEIVLWEFDDGDDADLGFTFGKPQIAKMANGDWAAIFGNGYNNTAADGTASTTGHGVIYVVDIQDGSIIKKFDTEVGTVGTPNGVATPLLIDSNGDFVVDYIYAGDMEGNMWKMDVTNTSTASWDFDYYSAGDPQPLFTTEDGQPITSQPQAALHPDNLQGFMIYFGTGKYIEIDDNEAYFQDTQAFYGVWDKNNPTLTVFDSDDLLKQYISNQYAESFDSDDDGTDDTDFTLRDVTENEIDWTTHMGFKIDLKPVLVEGAANTDNFGERQVSNAIVRNGRIIFTTLTPSQVECEFGGTSFLMQLDYRDGGALGYPSFDMNGDGEYDGTDTNASGRASDVGIMPTVSILADGAQDVAFGSGASGNIDVIQLSVGNEAFGRQSWRQLE
ncbi:MAG: PilC/PilY family type IV pilus protein [Pseudohongiellaceae bacterium]